MVKSKKQDVNWKVFLSGEPTYKVKGWTKSRLITQSRRNLAKIELRKRRKK